jgi:hypothetical protein
MRSPSRAAAVLLLAVVAFALLGAAATISRSLIPLAVDGTVTAVEVRREKHPGIDDVWLVHPDDGRRLHVDANTARHVPEGGRLVKPRWARTLQVDGRPLALPLSDDARGMLWVMPLTILAAAGAMAASLRMDGARR